MMVAEIAAATAPPQKKAARPVARGLVGHDRLEQVVYISPPAPPRKRRYGPTARAQSRRSIKQVAGVATHSVWN